ncbi:MAG: tetratricopeptide repeat protein [Phycisphaerales bacterium]
MAKAAAKPESAKPTIFIVRPWHDARASLYPHIMDGVEYVEAVIEQIQAACKESFDVRFDKEVFLPGRTLRENVEGELESADIVIVILDGLRPNVVYELGLARGLRLRNDPQKPHIVCIVEKDATVLVRNFFPSPTKAPTINGAEATVLNPRLDSSRFLSDNSDLLLLVYDRLRLPSTLGKPLTETLSRLNIDPPTQPTLDQGIKEGRDIAEPAAQTATAADSSQLASDTDLKALWALYEKGNYSDVIAGITTNSSPEHRKVLALSLMKSRKLSQAVQVWKGLVAEKQQMNAARFHLGVCYYALGDYEAAIYWFEDAAKNEQDPTRANQWLERVKKRLPGTGSDTPGSAPAKGPSK